MPNCVIHPFMCLARRRCANRVIAWALVAVACIGAAPPTLHAQADMLAAYERADRIRTFDPLLVGGRVYPVWLGDGARFYYQANGNGPDRGTYYLVDPRARTRSALFDRMRVASALSAATGTPVDAEHLPPFVLADDDRALQFALRDTTYWCDLNTVRCAIADRARLLAAKRRTGPEWAVRSPDGSWDAFVWNYNVYIRPARLTDTEPSLWQSPPAPNVRRGCDAPAVPGPIPPRDSLPLPRGSIPLTTNATTRWGFGLYRFGLEVAHVDLYRYLPARGDLQWSPDSRKLLGRRDDLRGVRTYPLYSSTSNQPVDHSYFYAVPGDSAIPRYTSWIFDVARRSALQVQSPPDGLLDGGEIRWGRTAGDLFLVQSSRDYRSVRLSRVDTRTGALRTIAGDSAATFVEPRAWHVSNGSDDVLWWSERDGWGHLYRYGRNGALKQQLERGNYVVDDIIRVDSMQQQVYFTAWGKEAGVPNYARLYRIGMDGTGMTLLTPEPGNHTIRPFPTAPFFLDTYSQVEVPPITVVRDANGTVVMELARGDATPLRATGWSEGEVFTVKARDGTTDLWGILYKPSTFDPRKRYPIVTYVYPGPQRGSVGDWVFKGPDWVLGTSVETRQDRRTASRVMGEEGMRRSLAELGFIVIQLDALGSSPQRSKAFHEFYYGRVRDNGLADQVAAIRQLGADYAWIDTTRVGIVGHSGGGYTAAAGMLHYPDFFKVGVASSGNHDFRVYGWYWGEKYQGPYVRNGKSDNYEAEANYRYAAQLKGKLLLMTGDMDCNNPPAETLRLADALQQEGKEYDMLMVTDAGHQRSTYAIKRGWDYFVRYLLGVEPPPGYRMMVP